MLSEILLSLMLAQNPVQGDIGSNSSQSVVQDTVQEQSVEDLILINYLSEELPTVNISSESIPYAEIYHEKDAFYEHLKEGYAHPEWVDIFRGSTRVVGRPQDNPEKNNARLDSLLQVMLSQENKDGVTHFLIGQSYFHKTEFQQAKSYYKKAISESFHNSHVYQKLADIKAREFGAAIYKPRKDVNILEDSDTQELAEMVLLYEEAIMLEKNEEVHNRNPYFHLAELYSFVGQHQNAFRTFQEVLEMPQSDERYYFYWPRIVQQVMRDNEESEVVRKAARKAYIKNVDKLSFDNEMLFFESYNVVIEDEGYGFTDSDKKLFRELYHERIESNPFIQ